MSHDADSRSRAEAEWPDVPTARSGHKEDLSGGGGLTAILLDIGIRRIPLHDTWSEGWGANPFLRLAIAQTWHITPLVFACVLAMVNLTRWMVPLFQMPGFSLGFTLVGICIASGLVAAWHVGRMRRLVSEDLLATLLTPRDIIQGLALVPWALTIVWCIVFLTIDAVLAALPALLVARPDVFIIVLAGAAFSRFLLYHAVLGIVGYTTTIGVRQFLDDPARQDAGARWALALGGMMLLHVVRVLWFVWVAALGVLIFLGSASVFGDWGILLGFVAFVVVAMLGLIFLRIPTEFQSPAHLSPFHPYDTDFRQWNLVERRRDDR